MKKIVILLIITIIVVSSQVSEASWYVVNSDNKVIVKCEYEPDLKDLESRKEFSVFTKEDISLSEAEYKKGSIIRRVKTPAEIAQANKIEEQEKERKLIEEKLKAMAIEKLKSDGVELKSQQGK